MQEAMQVFGQLRDVPYLSNTVILLCFNKVDAFRAKVRAKRNFAQVFPDFEGE